MSLIAFACCGVFATNAYNAQLTLLAGLTAALDRISRPLLTEAQERRLEKFASPSLSLPASLQASRRPRFPSVEVFGMGPAFFNGVDRLILSGGFFFARPQTLVSMASAAAMNVEEMLRAL